MLTKTRRVASIYTHIHTQSQKFHAQTETNEDFKQLRTTIYINKLIFKPTTQITVLQFCNFLHENEILRRINSHGSNTRIRACFTYSIFLLPAQC